MLREVWLPGVRDRDGGCQQGTDPGRPGHSTLQCALLVPGAAAAQGGGHGLCSHLRQQGEAAHSPYTVLLNSMPTFIAQQCRKAYLTRLYRSGPPLYVLYTGLQYSAEAG